MRSRPTTPRALDNARKEIEEYEEELADFLAGQSHGRLGRTTARAAVTEHVAHLTMQADAYAKQDYAAADKMYRLGYEHSYDLGLALARGAAPGRRRRQAAGAGLAAALRSWASCSPSTPCWSRT